MPSRIVRGDELLNCDKYMGLPHSAQAFFLHLWVSADDFGLLQLSSLFIGRRCFRKRPSDGQLDRLIKLLKDAGLLRVYEFDGAKFAFIPNFGQRLQRFVAKYPS